MHDGVGLLVEGFDQSVFEHRHGFPRHAEPRCVRTDVGTDRPSYRASACAFGAMDASELTLRGAPGATVTLSCAISVSVGVLVLDGLTLRGSPDVPPVTSAVFPERSNIETLDMPVILLP